MKKKINRILLAVSVLVALAVMLGTTFVFDRLYRQQVRDDLVTHMELMKAVGVFDDPAATESVRDKLTIDTQELRITWIDRDGTVIFDNDTNEEQLENHKDRPEVRQAFETGSGEIVRNSDTMNSNTYYYANLLDNGTVVRVAIKAHSMLTLMLNAFSLMLVIMVITGVATFFSAHFLTKRLMKPIEDITAAIEAESLQGSGRRPVSPMSTKETVPEPEYSYPELQPFLNTIRSQHEKILDAAKSRQDFTANVSHELKTPLTAIGGYAELIENGVASETMQKRFAGEIQKNATRLLSLINDIIRLSELDNGQEQIVMEKSDLYQVAKSQVESLQINAQSRQIILYFEGKTCVMRMNRDMIMELIDNLVQNAIRYNNPGGRVWVSVHREDGHPVLTVGDNGIGIPRDQQEHIFERFYRVDKSRSKATGGTGLGLAIVKHIVELHDAKLYLDSAPGKGTVIKVVF